MDGYLPIEDYGAIGNLRTVALVGRNGSIDWCCLPEIDSPSLFAAILDRNRGGRFRIAPVGSGSGTQRYLDRTNVLETRFESDDGVLTVTDFLPLRGSIIGAGDPDTRPEIHRLVRCESGTVAVELEWAPRFDYARAKTRIRRTGSGCLAAAGSDRLAIGGVPDAGRIEVDGLGPVLRARFELATGQEAALVARHGAEHADASLERTRERLKETVQAWRGWVAAGASREWSDAWEPLVTRSALVLKLLTHPDTGAIAAAATTSLPEVIGGIRNWDYRYSWIRDASLTVQALLVLGHDAEARDFVQWASRAVRSRGEMDPGLQIMFGVHGEVESPEAELAHLEGYRLSSPVRIGNGAELQWQHDTYGDLLAAAHEMVQRGAELDSDVRRFLPPLADEAAELWQRPDSGIWEMRSGPRHFVHSKWMVAVALDRAVRMADEYGLDGDRDRWARARDAARDEVLRSGYDPRVDAFTLTYRTRVLDAANLRIPLQGFLPPDDPRVQGTIDRTLERMTVNGLVYRYLADDGLPGEEGTFVAATFWLVSALALSGRVDEAREIFEGAAGRASPIGLFSEEIDAHSGEFLGNFPQAFSHIAFINAAVHLALAEGRDVPDAARAIGERYEGASQP